MPVCPLCGAALEGEGHVSRKDACPVCHADLHACHACALHDPNAHNQCREPRAEWQPRRDKANFCDFFQLAGPPAGGGGDDREAERKRRLDDLFKNL